MKVSVVSFAFEKELWLFSVTDVPLCVSVPIKSPKFWCVTVFVTVTFLIGSFKVLTPNSNTNWGELADPGGMGAGNGIMVIVWFPFVSVWLKGMLLAMPANPYCAPCWSSDLRAV